MKTWFQIRMSLARRNPFRKIGFKHLGKKSVIFKPLFLNGKQYMSIGDRVSFMPGARIECVKNYAGGAYSPSIEIGDNTSFEQNAHITSAGVLKIGKNCAFIADVLITNIDHDYSDLNEPVSKQKLIVNETIIGDNCFIGMRASIFPGVHIGNNVIVGANAIVTHDVPSYCVVTGAPAKIIKRYDFDKKKWISVTD